MTDAQIRAQQQELVDNGYNIGTSGSGQGVDGDWGDRSKTAWAQYQEGKGVSGAVNKMGGLFNQALSTIDNQGTNMVQNSNTATTNSNTLADGTVLTAGQAGYQGPTGFNQVQAGVGNVLQGGSQVIGGGAQAGGGILGMGGGLLNLARGREGAGGQFMGGLGNTASGIGNILGGGVQAATGAIGAVRPMMKGAGKALMGMGKSSGPVYSNFRQPGNYNR